MLYFTYGTDTEKVRIRHSGLIDSLLKRKPNATLVQFDDINLTERALEECLGGQGLFEKNFIVEIDRVILDEEKLAIVDKWIKEIAQSENIFIWREGKFLSKVLKKLKTHATQVQDFDIPKNLNKKAQNGAFNIFDMGDAIGRKDKKNLWVLYEKARLKGLTPEGVHGTLHWQVRAILAVVSFPKSSAGDLGINSFVYNKSKDFARNYTLISIRDISKKLILIHKKAREGGDILDVALEKFILSL